MHGRSPHRQPVCPQRHHRLDPRLEDERLATADKKPVKNVELWQRLDAALKPHEVRWHWVKGHAGHAENERADQLAREGVAMARLKQ